MPNSYYNYLIDLLPGSKTRSLTIDQQFAAIEAAFDLLGDPGDLNSGAGIYGTDTGSADAYIVTNSSDGVALIEGQLITFKPAEANTTASTLSANGNPNVALVRSDGEDLQANDLIAGVPVFAIYDGTRWVLLTPTPSQVFNRPNIIPVAASRDIAAADESAILNVDTSGGDITLTLPANATTALPIGFMTHLYNTNANDIIVAPAGGVTMNNAIGPRTRATFSTLSVVKIAINEWMLLGDATA